MAESDTKVLEGQLVRTDAMGGTEITASLSRQIEAMAARDRAEIEGLFVMAQRHPRNWDLVRTSLLKDCDRGGFCDKAVYIMPRGNTKVTGLTIRFAEAAMRSMGNIMCSAPIVEETPMTRTYRVRVLDLERLAYDSQDVMVTKTIERKADRNGNPPAGYEVVGQRLNKSGEKLFIVLATEDDLLMLMNRSVSKMRRNKILEMVPPDIRDECHTKALSTKEKILAGDADAATKDPDAYVKKTTDAWARLGVTPAELEKYLGHPLRQSNRDEWTELFNLHGAVEQRETTWREALESRVAERDGGREKPPEAKPTPPKANEPVDPNVKPAEQTEAFAAWVMMQMRKANTEADLKTLAAFTAKAPKQFHDAIGNTYAVEKTRIAVKK